jgi:hypothetical protein
VNELEIAGLIRDEEQLTLFPFEADAHELYKYSSVGTWYRGYCSCGWLSGILPARWRVAAQHGEHRRWQAMSLDDPHRVRRAH